MSDFPAPKRDFRQEVTNQIIAMLERGTAPWQKPWDAAKVPLEMPHNPTTDKPYRGGNAVHLLFSAAQHGFNDPRWMTYKQANENGWQVRKGERGTQIEFWQFKDDQREGGDGASGEKAERFATPLRRVYTVFNAAQIEGIPAREPKITPEWEAVAAGERILSNSGAKIFYDQRDRAFYSRAKDEIHMPPQGAFSSAARFYGTALHELAHWSGAESRLNRSTLVNSKSMGDENYAKEELRAELASLFLAAERGIPHDPEGNASYLGAWIKVLRQDKNEIFRAAKDASNATEYLLAREHGMTRGQTETLEPERLETSEHVAEFEPATGVVEITEKNTATEVREFVEPASTARAPSAAGKVAQEQILDGVVDGKAAPMDAALTRAGAVAAARSLVEQKLGEGARLIEARTDSGHYEGPLIGATDRFAIQQITPHAAVLHDRDLLGQDPIDATKRLSIDYKRGMAELRQIQPPLREAAQLER